MRVNGCCMELELDDLICRRIFLEGVFERGGTEAARALVQPGGVVFDVGAHIGYYSLLFAGLAGEHGMVHAFEPVPRNAARLRRNLALNPPLAARVRVHEIALSDSERTRPIVVTGPANTGASHFPAPHQARDAGRDAAGVAETISVACRKGDAVWEELGRPAVTLVKLDIEGHELPALRGMTGMLSRLADVSVLVEVRESFLLAAGATPKTLFDMLGALGFGSYDFHPPSGAFLRNDTPRGAELVIFSKRAL